MLVLNILKKDHKNNNKNRINIEDIGDNEILLNNFYLS